MVKIYMKHLIIEITMVGFKSTGYRRVNLTQFEYNRVRWKYKFVYNNFLTTNKCFVAYEILNCRR